MGPLVAAQAAAQGNNGAGVQGVVFVVLLSCCLAIAIYEIVKRMQPTVTIEKLAALGIGVCFLVVAGVALCMDGGPLAALVMGFVNLMVPVAAALGLIWLDDVIGDLLGIKWGWVNKATPGVLIRFMGWVFLLGIIGMTLFFAAIGP